MSTLFTSACMITGAYFCMGAYKSDVVNYIHGCLFSMGAYFTVYEDVSSFVIRHWNSNTSSSLYFVDAVIWCNVL